MSDNQTIDVIVNPAPPTRGRYRAVKLDVNALRDSLHELVTSMAAALAKLDVAAGSFNVDEVKCTFEINAKGGFMLLGTGAEAGARGGIDVTFKRRTTITN